MTPAPLKISSLQEASPLQASKWLKHQFLVDTDEMKDLLQNLGTCYQYFLGGKYPEGEEWIRPEIFLECYQSYITALKEGKIPDDKLYRPCFSSILTATPDALCLISVGNNQNLIRIVHPVIQLQAHQMDYSPIDGKFRSMVLGSNNILWGLQFSYPQIFQNPKTHAIEKVADNANFPNTALFRRLQLWLRHNTAPTPFLIGDKKVNVPVRLGKKCFNWINCHPQLASKGLKIEERKL